MFKDWIFSFLNGRFYLKFYFTKRSDVTKLHPKTFFTASGLSW